MAADRPLQHADRLVAFLSFLTDGDEMMGNPLSLEELQGLLDQATEANLGDIPTSAEAQELYDVAYGLTGATAKARAQIASLSDGEQPGMKSVGPDQIAEVVERVTRELAEETAAAEQGRSLGARPPR